ncbi:hypothetical protein [Candidatus Soleaferrea massiliensis]|uniref:hypothetical protein n=1 Tax=Candidatus Soleaferrea massiliensis TaxID=1470354 RepID=UPI00058C6A03|nr:hypothetical protein [Candidatus Soleaferrea massiliensis]
MFQEIPQRVDLQMLREFILTGGYCMALETDSYELRIRKAECELDRILSVYFSNPESRNTFDNQISNVFNTYQEVYFELGMKTGAKLLSQLLFRQSEM